MSLFSDITPVANEHPKRALQRILAVLEQASSTGRLQLSAVSATEEDFTATEPYPAGNTPEISDSETAVLIKIASILFGALDGNTLKVVLAGAILEDAAVDPGDSTAASVEDLVDDFNALLQALRDARILAAAGSSSS